VIAEEATSMTTLRLALEEARGRALDLGADAVLLIDSEGNNYGPFDVGGF
jgi:uncharacterized protein YbjQ (UPF0145 family)